MSASIASRLGLGGLVLAAGLGLFAEAAPAAVLIVSSDTPALRPGQELADSERLEVPAGASVRVLLPSGRVRALVGPVSTPVADMVRGEPAAGGFWARAKEWLTGSTGAAASGGATRGARPGRQAATFTWNVIPVASMGTVCVGRGAPVSLERAADARFRQVEIVDKATGARGQVAWAGSDTKTPWPASLPARADASYEVHIPNAPVREVKLAIVDAAMTDEANTLRTLIDLDCRQQTGAYLAMLRRMPAR
jgi:hypothetical protein